MKLSKNTKIVIFLGIIIVTPIVYVYLMSISSLFTLELISHIETPNKTMVNVFLIFYPTFGIIIIGILLSFPLIYMFDKRAHLAALGIAFVMVVWLLSIWTSNFSVMPSYLPLIEWALCLLLIPFVVSMVQKWKSRKV